MHEMSLAESVIQMLEDSARRQGFGRVRTLWLEIGQLALVEVEALNFCFEALAQGTVAEGAVLKVINTPGRGWCRHCRREVEYRARYQPCPYCQGYQVSIVAGDEMRVKELEVSD